MNQTRGNDQGFTRDEPLHLPATVDITTAARALGLGRSTGYELARPRRLSTSRHPRRKLLPGSDRESPSSPGNRARSLRIPCGHRDSVVAGCRPLRFVGSPSDVAVAVGGEDSELAVLKMHRCHVVGASAEVVDNDDRCLARVG